jgi:hypothetical protein
MRRFRFHIGTLVILVLVLGVGFAALRESNEIWDSITFTLTVGVLLTSVLMAIHQFKKRRAFWLGFALFGAAYLLLSLVPPIESRLITTKDLAYLDSKLSGSSLAGLVYFDYDNDGKLDLYAANNSQPGVLYLNNGNGSFVDLTTTVGFNQPIKQAINDTQFFLNSLTKRWLSGSSRTTENFIHIGHSLLALIVSFVGGHLSQYLHSRNLARMSGMCSPETGQEPTEHFSGQRSTS